MQILIVIVNYRTADLVTDCLASLRPEIEAIGDAKIVVVDGASGDDSVDKLRRCIDTRGYGPWCELMPLDHNGGFAYGNNAAIRPALHGTDPPRHVLLLNPDTVVRPGAVRGLLAFMEAHPEAGIAGSRLEEPDGTPQRSAFRFPTAVGELEQGLRLGVASRLLGRWVVAPPPPDEAQPSDWVSGASFLVRREVFDAIGLLDEGYFMYFEEVDFCLRARRAGWATWYVPASRVVHLVGQASGIGGGDRPAARRPGYLFDSRKRYYLKNHGRGYALAADAAWLAGYAAWRLRRALQRKPDRDPPRLLVDSLRHSVFVAGFGGGSECSPASNPGGAA